MPDDTNGRTTPADGLQFVHDQPATRVVFGPGRFATLPAEVARLAPDGVVLLVAARAESGLAERATRLLAAREVQWVDDVRPHVPVDAADRAAERARTVGATVVVSVGGGSATGLAKAVALRTGLVILAVPTTYAGSEVTPIWGQTEGRRKTTGRDPVVLPRTVIYDAELTVSLPAAVSGPSGINALAHCVEALYAAGANPITSALALDGIRALWEALPVVVSRPDDLGGQGTAQYGAYVSGYALATAGISVHHHVCHTLGGMFDLPHAELHTVMLPHSVAAVARAVPRTMARLSTALDHPQPGVALRDLAVRLGAPTRLIDIGMRAEDLVDAASAVAAATRGDVVELDDHGAGQLLRDAFEGTLRDPEDRTNDR